MRDDYWEHVSHPTEDGLDWSDFQVEDWEELIEDAAIADEFDSYEDEEVEF